MADRDAYDGYGRLVDAVCHGDVSPIAGADRHLGFSDSHTFGNGHRLANGCAFRDARAVGDAGIYACAFAR